MRRRVDLKRALDVTLALVATPFAAPILLGCIAAIRLTSPGPAIFRQVRLGRHERPFTCYKLRTMQVNTREAPSHETDPAAVTSVGRRLRRLRLDELPQLWNVLRGDMSFVGPRPCLPSQEALIGARRRYGLFAIRPGLTGVSQVAGIDMSEPERLAASDASYLDGMSLVIDLRLILATLAAVGHRDHVRR